MAPKARAIPAPMLWMPGTSRVAMPAILATTPSAMVVFPRVSAGAPAPVRPFSALTPVSGRLPPPTLVMLSVMAVASSGSV
jgi:hypothetical protein